MKQEPHKSRFGEGMCEGDFIDSYHDLASILETVLDAIIVANPDGTIRTVNRAALDLLGYAREELVGEPIGVILEEDFIRGNGVAQLLREGAARNVDLILLAKSGEQIPVVFNGSVIREKDGSLSAVVGVARDIRERKRAEEALQEAEARLHNIIEKNADGIVIVDKDGMVLFMNRAGEDLFGRKAEELLGGSFGFPLIGGETTELDIFRRGKEGVVAEMRVVEIEWEAKPAYLASLRDITERKQTEETLRHYFISLAEAVSQAINLRSPYSATHERGLGKLLQRVGQKLGFDRDRLQDLYIGALLHDIGKMAIPESILRKPGSLTEEETAVVRTHARRGHTVLKDAGFPGPAAELALHHHERMDGSGYPDGLKGDELCEEVRILAVCNVVDAMSSHRPWRPARSKREILDEIRTGRGTKYDPDAVDVLVEMIESGELELAGEGGSAGKGETATRRNKDAGREI